MIRKLLLCSNFHENTEPTRNLAIEEYLLTHAAPDTCTLFLWQNRKTVVIGRNQNAWRECLVQKLTDDGGFLVRRLSGGGAVYHDLGNLNFTFLVRRTDYDVARQLAVVLDAVQAFGIPAETVGRNDLAVQGRKFSGNAFYRTGECCYHHGTLLVSAALDELSRYLQVSKAKLAGKGVASVRARVANLNEFSSSVTVPALEKQLACSFSRVYGLPVEPLPAESLPEEDIQTRQERFAAWDWRMGETYPFTVEIGRRFAWGELLLRFEIKNGMIHHACCESDGLEQTFLAGLPDALVGCRCEAQALTERLTALQPETAAAQEIVQSAIALVRTQME